MYLLTQVVNTLEAALSKWKLRTDLILSANKVRTYSSPPFKDITSLSSAMKLT